MKFSKKIILSIGLQSIILLGWSQNESNNFSSVENIVKFTLSQLSTDLDSLNQKALRSAFTHDAELTMIYADQENSRASRTFSIDDFIKISSSNQRPDDFNEVEINLEYFEFNGMASAFQTYELTANAETKRGINAYQLFQDGKRWWISDVFWTEEIENFPIPSNYLPSKN